MPHPFNADDMFALVPGLEVTQVPDGAMVYQSARERVHYLNPTAAIVFELCGMGKSVTEIETFLSDGFALDTLDPDAVRTCLDSMITEGLIVPADR